MNKLYLVFRFHLCVGEGGGGCAEADGANLAVKNLYVNILCLLVHI